VFSVKVPKLALPPARFIPKSRDIIRRMNNIVIVTFYKFIPLPDFQKRQLPLLEDCLNAGLKGTILLAKEGINGTLAGSREGIDAVLNKLKQDSRFTDLITKESVADNFPFRRMKVRLKNEIVSMGQPGVNPADRVGAYVPPEDWNSLISEPDVLLVDARNDYEVGIGSFEGAVSPKTDTFREFPAYVEHNLNPKKHKKVAMFCTGGIRCEKATSFMLDRGFDKVYHLQGGILKYLEKVPEQQSLWHGECFVFDDRVAVDHSLKPGSYRQCYACRRPLSKEDLLSSSYSEGISCPHCIESLTDDQRSRFSERQRQIELARERKKTG